MVYFRILEMRKWDDTLLLKCFNGKLKNDFIREDEEVVEARLSFLEKNQRYILNTNLLCLLGILSICLSVWFCVCMLHSLFSYKNLEPNRAEYKFSNITTSLYSRANFWLVSGLISCSDCFLLAWLLSGWVTALVSLSISLVYGSCQDGFSFCMIIFLYLALARLISPHFPHVWFLLGSFCSVWFGSFLVDVRLMPGSNVRLYSGSCLARHFRFGFSNVCLSVSPLVYEAISSPFFLTKFIAWVKKKLMLKCCTEISALQVSSCCRVPDCNCICGRLMV